MRLDVYQGREGGEDENEGMPRENGEVASISQGEGPGCAFNATELT